MARETLSAIRKDVTAGLYGGHYERKVGISTEQNRTVSSDIPSLAQASGTSEREQEKDEEDRQH
jgi:hypothetical protein